jgi:hypothetical protein
MAAGCGVIWALIASIAPFAYVNLLIAPAVGYGIGEVTGLSVNRKRGRGLAIIGGLAVVLSLSLSVLFPWGQPISLSGILYWIVNLVAVALGVVVAVTRLR